MGQLTMTTMNATTHPVIDPQAIEDLRALNPEDPAFLRELIDLFIQDVPGRITEIEQALASKDAVLLTRAAHTIKGSCSNFGATSLREISHAMEMQGKASDFATAATSLVTLRAAFADVTVALNQVS
jgi:HPt (histidine-containing phosphotransfer) domain-containing protein